MILGYDNQMNAPANIPQIFDSRAAAAQAYRVTPDAFLTGQLAERLAERLQALSTVPQHVALFGPLHPALVAALPQTRFSAALITAEGQLQVENGADHILDLGTLALVNDLPGALAQIRATLKPGGGFFSVLLGGASLMEVRQALLQAEMELTGGGAPRLHPTLSGEVALQLLQRAGFATPVADRELLSVSYKTIASLTRDLREAHLSNRLTTRSRTIPPRKLFPCAEQHWREMASAPNERMLATFEIIALTGWKQAE